MTNLSIDQVIADMGGWTALKAYFEGNRDAMEAKIQGLIGNIEYVMGRAIYIHPVNGDDANVGSSENPVKTLDGVAALMVSGGQYTVFVMDDLTIAKTHTFPATNLLFASDVFGTKRLLWWATQIDGTDTASPSLDLLAQCGAIYMRDMTISGSVAAPHVTQKRMFITRALTMLSFWQCDFVVPVGADLPLISPGAAFGLWLNSCTYPAAMAGLWVTGIAAGSDPANHPRIISTSLATL